MEDPKFEASLGYTERPLFKTSKAYSLAFQFDNLRSKLRSPWQPEAGTAGPRYWTEDNRQPEAEAGVLRDETTGPGQRVLGLEGQVPFGWKQISFL